MPVASRAPPHYIERAGLRGASGVIFSGPYRSLRELSLTGPVGSDTWRPPTFVGNPGSLLQRPSGSALAVIARRAKHAEASHRASRLLRFARNGARRMKEMAQLASI